MTDDLWDAPEARDWSESVLKEMAPKLEQSAFSISMYDGHHDVKLWVELGASIYMNKPILLTVFEGAEIPPKLALIADEIVRLKSLDDPESKERFEAALARMLKKVGEDE
jgi:hypothetical protein